MDKGYQQEITEKEIKKEKYKSVLLVIRDMTIK